MAASSWGSNNWGEAAWGDNAVVVGFDTWGINSWGDGSWGLGTQTSVLATSTGTVTFAISCEVDVTGQSLTSTVEQELLLLLMQF